MTWEHAVAHARQRAAETGRRWYVRGYQRTISHIGDWLYGAYAEPYPELTSRWPRPEHWAPMRDPISERAARESASWIDAWRTT